MKRYLLFILLPFSANAEDFFVQDDLADMVEQVVRTTNLKINIPDMAQKYVRIDQIDGLNVCSPEAKQKVIKLQTAFTEHPHMLRTKSIHGTYHRQDNGKIVYNSFKPTSQKTSANKCEYVTVTVR